MKLSTTTEATFDADIQDDRPVLVKFTAPWCGPCQRLTPQLERLADNLAGQLKILSVNVDESESLAKRFSVRGIPTMILFVNGKEYAHLNEFTTMRMRIQIDQWFAAQGMTPANSLPVPEPDAPGTASSEAPQWRAFNGDETAKAACMSRIREEEDDDRLNAACLTDVAGQPETTPGIPEDFGALLDALCFGFRHCSGEAGKKQVRSRFSAWVSAIPVGANLGSRVQDFLYHLLYGSDWGIIPSALSSDAERHLFVQMSALHKRERRGEGVARSEWDPVQRAAIAVSKVNDVPFNALETLAVPVAEWSWSITGTLIAVSHFHRGQPNWGSEDLETLHRLQNQSHEQVSRELEPLPADASPEAAAKRHAQWQGRLNELHQEQRETDPEFWARFDTMKARDDDTQLRYYTFISDALINQLQALES
ncbi:thioredoxin family protein [Citrobacter sp. ESBL3]|uniref:thioredoxin family protein n=1 Tax=Citrobacter sp. ESBL3 TaxID=3077326 RepID=UPI002FCADB14